MAQTFQLDTFQEDVARITADVFQTMLGVEVHPDPSPPPSTRSAQLVTAAVYFAGQWKGALLVECTVGQALHFTARLFGAGVPECINDDVRDAAGELANMIAGNLKSVLPGGVSLSMPSVVEGQDYTLKVCGGNLSTRLRFQSPLGVFSVILVEVLAEA